MATTVASLRENLSELLRLACKEGSFPIIEMIITQLKVKPDGTHLIEAVESGDPDIISFLRDHGVTYAKYPTYYHHAWRMAKHDSFLRNIIEMFILAESL
jgi:hypothetical protein